MLAYQHRTVFDKKLNLDDVSPFRLKSHKYKDYLPQVTKNRCPEQNRIINNDRIYRLVPIPNIKDI